MIEESILDFMGEDHIEAVLVIRKNGYTVSQPLKYTDSMVMAEELIRKLSPEFVELWNDASGWNCNLVIDKITYNSKHEDTACFAIAKAAYNFLRRENGTETFDIPISSDNSDNSNLGLLN